MEQDKISRVGRFRLHNNHLVFKCNTSTKELKEFTFVDASKGANIMVEKDCVYFSALNVKNAKRKIKKVFGIEVEFKS